MRATHTSPRIVADESALRRELYFFALYRVLEAAMFVAVVFSPLSQGMVELRHPLAAALTSSVYLVIALALLLAQRRSHIPIAQQAALGLGVDLFAGTVALHAMTSLQAGTGLLLAVNIGAGALLMPVTAGLAFATLAAVLTAGEWVLSSLIERHNDRPLTEMVMFAVMYVAIARLTQWLGGRLEETQALADRRGAEVANLAQLNELIIRRMRTGVLVVDVGHQVQLMNEAAWFLLGSPKGGQKALQDIAPELSRRLYHWRNEHKSDASPVAFAADVPEVIPRFARLTVTDDLFLVFLDDTSLVSRRAEQLTLTTLGRLSASIAHEIRNPLAAISYSAQLLEESPELVDTDRRLIEIIRSHCERMNGIVENILNLARRERARPEPVDLAHWVFGFTDEYKASHFMERDELKAVTQSRNVYAMVDPGHLHQVVSNLVRNALAYGRLPGEPARVTLVARQAGESSPALLEVIDRGPGIPPAVAASIFDPFYTTSEHGNGLGLYLARQLCEANQASLDYVAVAGGGSCFRISLARPTGATLPTARSGTAEA